MSVGTPVRAAGAEETGQEGELRGVNWGWMCLAEDGSQSLSCSVSGKQGHHGS